MSTCKTDLATGKKCGKDLYIIYKRVSYCKFHFDKINDNLCKHKLTNNNECSKKAGYTKDGKIFYCKTHFDKLNEIKCSKCTKKGKCAKDGINYCTSHYNDLNAKICKGKLKNGNDCTKKASFISNGLDYCKTHFDKLDVKICKKTNCTIKAFQNTNYCTKHLVEHTINTSSEIKNKKTTLIDKI